jgi:hypothetical protein
MNSKAKKVDGGYEYKGHFIYRTTEQRGAYNPWKVILGRSFPTLAAARKYIDSKDSVPSQPLTDVLGD